MADDDRDVTVRISVDGGPMPGGVLDKMMRDQGVRVVSRSSAQEQRGWESVLGDVAGITTLVVEGGRPAIKAALKLFRKRFPKAKIDDDGQGVVND